MQHRLFVRGFDDKMDAGGLEDLFANVGTVKSVKVERQSAGGSLRWVSYVEMSSAEEVRDCIDRYHGKKVGAHTLIVTEDKPHVPDPQFHAKRAAAKRKTPDEPRKKTARPPKRAPKTAN